MPHVVAGKIDMFQPKGERRARRLFIDPLALFALPVESAP
jgi:hypothetical protein